MGNYPFNNILLATEHTEFDAGAERLAFKMAIHCGLPLRVVIPMTSNPEYEAESPDVALRAELAVATCIVEMRKRADELGLKLDVHVRRGTDLHKEIVAEANESNSDLIVIRRRGKPSFLARMLVGEMVSKVIRDSKCSVLLVPRAAEFWNRRVLAAVGETPSSPNITKIAGAIAGTCGLPLTILSVASNQAALSKTQSLNTLNVSLASTFSNQVSGEVRIGMLLEQTILSVTEAGADLVVIERERNNAMLFGSRSVMQQIAGNMDVPTLVTPS